MIAVERSLPERRHGERVRGITYVCPVISLARADVAVLLEDLDFVRDPSERPLIQQMNDDLVFRWLLG